MSERRLSVGEQTGQPAHIDLVGTTILVSRSMRRNIDTIDSASDGYVAVDRQSRGVHIDRYISSQIQVSIIKTSNMELCISELQLLGVRAHERVCPGRCIVECP